MPDTRRPPAGGLSTEDDEGRILTIQGRRYRYTEAAGLVELETPAGVLTETEAAQVVAELAEPERSPHGNPYRDGWA